MYGNHVCTSEDFEYSGISITITDTNFYQVYAVAAWNTSVAYGVLLSENRDDIRNSNIRLKRDRGTDYIADAQDSAITFTNNPPLTLYLFVRGYTGRYITARIYLKQIYI